MAAAAVAGVGLLLLALGGLAALPWSAATEFLGDLSWPGRLAVAGGALLLIASFVWVGYEFAKRDHVEPGVWWLRAPVVVGAVLVVTALAVAVLLATLDNGNTQLRVEIVRTALTVGAGSGGIVALALASRRQWSAERSARSAEYDATEQRITELYAKAVEQLGSDKAAVRFGGLYALERLAQDNPSHRQTIVDVVCAYLRMPFEPPSHRRGAPMGLRGQEHSDEYNQELQVRQAAQTLLRVHLQYFDEGSFWPDMSLNLSGATLVDFAFPSCQVRFAEFSMSHFDGRAGFTGTQFGAAHFARAHFDDVARFAGAHFRTYANFSGARVEKQCDFEGALFYERATFANTQFCNGVEMGGARVRTSSVGDDLEREWPEGWLIRPPTNSTNGHVDGRPLGEVWGFLARE